MMNRNAALLGLVLAAVLLALGFLFLCAASRQPSRVLLALVLLGAGGALAAASGRTLRRVWERAPENLSDRITLLARSSGRGELTLSEVVVELGVPDEAALDALALLEKRGQCFRKHSSGSEFYVFPGLKPAKVVRRCTHCGGEFSVKTPLHQCPNCGGSVELATE